MARVFIGRHQDVQGQIRDHSNIARAYAALGKAGIEEVIGLVIQQAHRLGFVDEGVMSSDTTGVYPSQWRLSIPREALELSVIAEMADQENRSRIMTAMHYWEGAVRVEEAQQDGKPVGKGYVELTGYGTSSRPAL